MQKTGMAQRENARDWMPILNRYREPSHTRSVFELLITVAAFVLLWILMWATLDLGYWLSLIIAVPTAGLLVRVTKAVEALEKGGLIAAGRGTITILNRRALEKRSNGTYVPTDN